jgi:hypothetical protein
MRETGLQKGSNIRRCLLLLSRRQLLFDDPGLCTILQVQQAFTCPPFRIACRSCPSHQVNTKCKRQWINPVIYCRDKLKKVVAVVDVWYKCKCDYVSPDLRPGVKTKTVIFGYWEPFSIFYRNLGLNGNGNVYRNTKTKPVEKLGIGNGLRLFRPFPEIIVFIRYFTVGNKFGIFQKILNLNSSL